MNRIARSSRAGWTLLELLAVLALASAAVAAVGVGRARAGPDLQVKAAVAILQDLDGRARLVAERGSGAVLKLNGGVVLDGDGQLVVERSWPRSVQLRLTGGERALAFDGRGRSADYEVMLSSGDESALVSVGGITGWTEVTR